MTVFQSRRTKIQRALMDPSLRRKSIEDLQALAREVKVSVPGGASKDEIIQALTNATRSQVLPPRNARAEGEDAPRDVKIPVLHENVEGPVQEGGTGPGDEPEGSERPRDSRTPRTRPRRKEQPKELTPLEQDLLDVGDNPTPDKEE